MKAMIFAAGLGTRLAPLTDTCPKALISIGDRPMLCRAIGRLVEAGASEIVVNAHHHADMIKQYVSATDFGVTVHISDESDRLLDTGGGVVKASDKLDSGDDNGPIVLYNADILTDFPLREMLETHVKSGTDVTLLADRRDTSRHLLFDSNGLMRGWRNSKTGEEKSPFAPTVTQQCRPMAFGGVSVINISVLHDMKAYCPDGKFSITTYYIDACSRLSIRAFTPSLPYLWIDIGRPETLAMARKLIDRI